MSHRPRKWDASTKSDDSDDYISEGDGYETDPTETDTDTDGEARGAEAAWLLEDEDHPPEYYIRQLDELDDTEFVQEDYSSGTTSLLDRIHEQWHKHCTYIGKGEDPIALYHGLSVKFLYNFFDWLLNQRRGKKGRKLRGTKKASSLGLYWKLYRLVYERETGEKLQSHWNRSMHRALRKLAKKHGLDMKSREKDPMDVDDLILMAETNLTTTKMRYIHGRYRVQNNLFLTLGSLSGNRPGALLRLRYQDIIVTIIRDPEGGPHRRLIEFTPEFTKTYLGEKEGITWPVPEILFDPSLILSPHTYLLGLMFADNAFIDPIHSPEQLSRVYIEDFKNEQRVPLKPELDDVYVFRQAVKTVDGVRVPLDAPRLKYSTILPHLKKVGYILGLVNFIPYGLRYNAGSKFNSNGEVSDSLQNLMMRHANIRTFLRYYLSRRINVDARAIVHDLEPQRAIMKAASRMSRSIDPRRPHELTEEQSLSINEHPRVLALLSQRKNLRRKFKGTIKSNEGTPLYERYTDLSREITNERQRQRNALLKEIREKWEREQPVLDIERQLSGLKFAEDVKHTIDRSIELLPEQKQMIETIMTLPGQSLEAEVYRRDAATCAVIDYCKIEEGGSVPRNRRARPRNSGAMPAIKAEDNPSNRPPGPPNCSSLKAAMLSVYIKHPKERPTTCFLCVGNEKLALDARVYSFSRPGDLSKHFKRRHLQTIKEGDRIRCGLCKMWLAHKMHLQNHAARIHGTIS